MMSYIRSAADSVSAPEWLSDPYHPVAAGDATSAWRGARHLRTINPIDWVGLPIPRRDWLIQDLIPDGTVTLLTGDGGAGKSLLALQLCAAMATGLDWAGNVPTAGRSLYLSAEDDHEEMHRRLEDIRRFHGVGFEDLGNMRLVDLVGDDAVLGDASKSARLRATTLFASVKHYADDFQPALIVIDTLADAFAGEENSRAQARQFVGLLKGLARDAGCAVLLLSHPSLTGMASGSGTSGSTAWSNSVRSRLYFERAKAADQTEPNADLRTLTTMKANYSAVGVMTTLRWSNGVFVAQKGAGSLDRAAMENAADDRFLGLLRRLNLENVTVSTSAGANYAPAIMKKMPGADGVGKTALEAAMHRLLDRNQVHVAEFGPPSRVRKDLRVGPRPEHQMP
jgi:RecA-family ATPase